MGEKRFEPTVIAGGRKDDSAPDKLRYDLFPASLAEVAKVYTLGALKYEDRNWEKGMKWGRLFRAMMQHGWDWWWRTKVRHENGMHSLGSVAWYALALMEYERRNLGVDDRPSAARVRMATITQEERE